MSRTCRKCGRMTIGNNNVLNVNDRGLCDECDAKTKKRPYKQEDAQTTIGWEQHKIINNGSDIKIIFTKDYGLYTRAVFTMIEGTPKLYIDNVEKPVNIPDRYAHVGDISASLIRLLNTNFSERMN